MELKEFLTSRPNPFTREPQRTLDWDKLAGFNDTSTWLAPMSEALQAGHVPLSRLGGLPLMKQQTPWHESPSGPMAFVGQLHFAELAGVSRTDGPPCPRDGLLALFMDVDDLQPASSSHWKLV
jgi:hypothetical protein